MTDFSVLANRRDGSKKVFADASPAKAMESAMAWSVAREAAVVRAARQLLAAIDDIRDDLEATDETGATADAFAALDKALAEFAA